MPARFKPNPRAVEQIAKSPQMRRFLERTVAPVLDEAIAGCPVDTGRMRASLHVEVEEHGDRLRALVIAAVPYAAAVCSQDPFLSRSIDAAGLG